MGIFLFVILQSLRSNIQLLGVPAYEDAGVNYHHPQVENIRSALQGIAASDHKNEANGIAIYCEWEMDENKWQIWRKFIR